MDTLLDPHRGGTAATRVARILVLLALTGLLLTSLGCSRSSSQQNAAAGGKWGHVKLVLNWVAEPEFGGFYAGRDGGAFQRAGMELEIMGGGAGVPVLPMVASGKVDFGIVTADEVLNARARGVDVIPVFATFQTSPVAIMAHASRGARVISDVLHGGTLAIGTGAPFTLFLQKKFGFDKARVVPYDGGVAQFFVDKDMAQQCFATSEPLLVARQEAAPKVFLVADEGFNPYVGVVIVRKALWDEKPDEVRAFARAAREGWRTYLDDPRAANEVMAKLNPTIDAETWRGVATAQKPFIETKETGRDAIGKMTRERWETLGKQLVDIGLIQEAPPTASYLAALGE